jgi:hypothetical protein
VDGQYHNKIILPVHKINTGYPKCLDAFIIHRVFTKEWCGFKNVLNDYILQLDGVPPPIFTGMYDS